MATLEDLSSTNSLQQRRGPLSWSQWLVWSYSLHNLQVSDLNLRLPLDHKVSPEQVHEAIRKVISRHESLRTTFEYGPDGLRPRQVVWDPAAHLFDFQVVSAAASPPTVWFSSRHIQAYDLTARWPIKVLLATTLGGIPELCLRIHHLAIDFHGLMLLRSELRVLLGSSSSRTLPIVRKHPIDIALYEQSPSGRASNRRSIEFHKKRQARIEGFAEHNWALIARNRKGPEHANLLATATFSSSTIQRRILDMSRSLGVSPAAVITAAIATAFACVLDYCDLIFGFMVSNRHLPGAQNTICHLAQLSYLAATVDPGQSFGELAYDCSQEIIRATRSGHFHPNQRALKERSLGRSSIIHRGLVLLNLMIDDNDPFLAERAQRIPSLRDHLHTQTREVVFATGGAGVDVTLNPGRISIELSADARLLNESGLKILASLITNQFDRTGEQSAPHDH